MGRSRLALVPRPAPAPEPGQRALIWTLGLGAFGLAWSITTVAAYLPPVLGKFTSSSTLIGLVLAAEGLFAFFIPLIVGPTSDATQTSFGRRRPYMTLALLPMALALAAVAFMASFQATAFALFAFFFAYYLYEPPYRGLYPDLLDDRVFGRAQGVQHIFRGAALGGGLVGGGFLLALWEPAPFILAAGVVLVACGAVIVFVREDTDGERRYTRLRTVLAAPWRVVRRERNVRRFLVANTAWEATFAGMRTFVVLYIIDGLGQPLHVSSIVLAVVAGGYVTAAVLSGLFADQFGLGNVILGASWVYGLGLLTAGFASSWHWWYCALDLPGRRRGRDGHDALLGAPLQAHAGRRPRHGDRARDDDEGHRARARPARRGRGDRPLPLGPRGDGRLRGALADGGGAGAARHPPRRAPRRRREGGRVGA